MHYYFGYDGSGNMTLNSRISADYLGYDASQPHAVSSVRATEGSISPSRCEVGYNSRNRPAYITEEDWRMDIAYGGGLQREKSVLTYEGNPVRTTLFISGDCEHEETPTFSRYIDYIKVDGRTVALHVYNETANGDSIYYVQTDLLGSWERVVDADKNVVQSSHFDPWGNRMSPTDWTASQDGSGFRFHRGFTGHEHYDEFGIINMNARLYDPVLGRFFSPDPQVQSPFSTQGFNRYSYCGNNPVMYSDPDGEIFWLVPVIGAVVGGTINLVSKAIQGQIHSFGDGLAAFGIGAVAGAATSWTGAASLSAVGIDLGAGGFLGGFASGMASSFVSTSMLSVGNATYFGDPMPTTGQFLGTLAIGGVMSGVSNGLTALANNRTFWMGNNKIVYPDFSVQNRPIHIGNASQQSNVEQTYTAELNVSIEREYTVYNGVDNDKIVRYVGITKREPEIRYHEHLISHTERSTLNYHEIQTGLTLVEARSIEQQWINQYGLMKNGGQLF